MIVQQLNEQIISLKQDSNSKEQSIKKLQQEINLYQQNDIPQKEILQNNFLILQNFICTFAEKILQFDQIQFINKDQRNLEQQFKSLLNFEYTSQENITQIILELENLCQNFFALVEEKLIQYKYEQRENQFKQNVLSSLQKQAQQVMEQNILKENEFLESPFEIECLNWKVLFQSLAEQHLQKQSIEDIENCQQKLIQNLKELHKVYIDKKYTTKQLTTYNGKESEKLIEKKVLIEKCLKNARIEYLKQQSKFNKLVRNLKNQKLNKNQDQILTVELYSHDENVDSFLLDQFNFTMLVVYLMLSFFELRLNFQHSSNASFNHYLEHYQFDISDQQYSFRKRIYNSTKLSIKEFNQKAQKIGWKEGANQFTIMTKSERQQHLGLDPRDELVSYLQEQPYQNKKIIEFTKFIDTKNDTQSTHFLPFKIVQIQSYSKFTNSHFYKDKQNEFFYDESYKERNSNQQKDSNENQNENYSKQIHQSSDNDNYTDENYSQEDFTDRNNYTNRQYYQEERILSDINKIDPQNQFHQDLFSMMKHTKYYNKKNQTIQKDWHKENKVTEVKRQDSCKSGWAFAVLAAIESMYKIKKNISLDLSEQQLIDCTLLGCDGGWQEIAYNFIKKNTAQLEQNYKYKGKFKHCKIKPKTHINLQDYVYIKQRDMYDYLMQIADGPVSSNIHIPDELFKYQRGIVDTKNNRICPLYKILEPNHAVLAVGFKINLKYPHQSYIKFKNSWGKDWGEKGYFKLRLYNERFSQGPCGVISNSYSSIKPLRQKNYLKKKTKIENLEQKSIEELTIEQKHLVENKQKTLDKIQSFEDIRQLYLAAIKKKMPSLLELKEPTKAAVLEITLQDTDLLHDTMNLYHLGNGTKKGDSKCLDFLIKSNLGVQFQEDMQIQYDKVFESESYKKEARNQNYQSLQEYLKNREMVDKINQVVDDENFGNSVQEPDQEEPKEEAKKGIFFDHSDEDTDQENDAQEQEEQEEKNEEEDQQDEFQFKKMPIDSDHEDEFQQTGRGKNNNRRGGGNNRRGNYNRRGGNRGGHGNRGGQNNRGYERRGNNRGNRRARGGRRGNDNYRGKRDYYNKKSNDEQQQDDNKEQSSQ